MKKLILLTLAFGIFSSCASRLHNKSAELNNSMNSLKAIELDESGSIISLELNNGQIENVKSFTDEDWGIYKYRIDGLIGRLVKVNKLSNGNTQYEKLLSLKDRNKLPTVEELKEGQVDSKIIEKSKMGGFSLSKFLGLSITEKYCLQYMEKDIKSIYMEDYDFDLKLAKQYFDTQGENFNIEDYKVINGVILQQITFKEFTSGDTKINAADIPVDATVLISGNFAYTSSDTRYTIKYRVVPTYLTAKAIKDRADIEE